MWAANLADLELHTSLSLGKDILRPTFMVFDLDPGRARQHRAMLPGGTVGARHLRQLRLAELRQDFRIERAAGLCAAEYAVTYDQTKPFAHELARLLERQHPDLVVSDMKKALRTGKVLVDWSQNDDHKTTICVYSLRAKERPTVSTPVKWEEVENCLKKGDPNLLVFESDAGSGAREEAWRPVRAGAEVEAEAAAGWRRWRRLMSARRKSRRQNRLDRLDLSGRTRVSLFEVRATAAKAVKKKQTKTTPQKATSAAKSKAAAGRKRRQA